MAELPNDMFMLKIGSCWSSDVSCRMFLRHMMDNPDDLWDVFWGWTEMFEKLGVGFSFRMDYYVTVLLFQ